MATSSKGRSTYDREEAAEILDLAAALEDHRSGDDLGLTVDAIRHIADELGISAESVDAAVRSIVSDDRMQSKESRRSVRRRLRFIRHTLAYAVTVAILAVVDALGGGGWWFFYVAGIWGILLALHALRFVTRRRGPLERRLARD